MSRIGRSPIPVPSGVSVAVGTDNTVTVKGPQGELARSVPSAITIRQDGDVLVVERPDDQRQNRALHGLTRSLVANMVAGVTDGFSKELEIVGVGYRAIPKGPSALELALGFSHPVNVSAPDGVTFEVPTATRIIVKGIDKEKVGQVAADIRKLRKPEPYKGKGVRYAGRAGRAQGREGSQVMARTDHKLELRRRRHNRVRRKVHGIGRASAPGRVPLQQAHLRPAHRRRRRPHPGRGVDRRGRPAGQPGAATSTRPARWASWSPHGPRRPVSPPWSSTVAVSPITGGWPPWPTPPVPKDWSSRPWL